MTKKSKFYVPIVILLLFSFLIQPLVISCKEKKSSTGHIEKQGAEIEAQKEMQEEAQQEAQKVKATTTIYPLYDLLKNVGGDAVEATFITKPGQCPHFFELTPVEVRKMENVDIVFKIGLGFDDWADEGIRSISRDAGDVEVIEVNKGIGLIDKNPHIWLSPKNAIKITENIKDFLILFDPKNKNLFERNSQKYIEELRALDREMEGKVSSFKQRKFIAFHEAWVYLAKDYGLEQIASIEPFPGKEPTPEYIVKLQKLIKENNIDFIFIEPQMSTEVVNFLAEDMDLEIYTLDPLGGVKGRETYIDLMLYNLGQFEKALRG